MSTTKPNPGNILITTLILANIILAALLTYYLASHKSYSALANSHLKKAFSRGSLSREKAPSSLETSEVEVHTDSTANVLKESIPAPPTHQQRSVSPESKPEEPSSDKQTVQQTLLTPAVETNLLASKKEEGGKEGLRITNLVFAKSIDDLLPSGEGTAFHFSIGRVYCWMEVENASPPTTLKHIYSFKDQKILEVELQIKYPHMRLWSYKTISENIFVGKWRVDIADNDGKILTTGYFDITE